MDLGTYLRTYLLTTTTSPPGLSWLPTCMCTVHICSTLARLESNGW